ncbi:unnamed protein product, partial [marine sediment metagenome]
EVTGEVMLGLGLRCARCHDHKYDPIPQRDYYRLQSFFAAMVPHDNILRTRKSFQRAKSDWNRATHQLRAELDKIETLHQVTKRRAQSWRFPPYIQTLYNKPQDQWSSLEKQYAYLTNPQIDKNADDKKSDDQTIQRLKELKQKLKEFDSLHPKPPHSVPGVTDVGAAAPTTFVAGRGSAPVEPGFLSILDPTTAKISAVSGKAESTGRRAALARWITRADNPLTSRVISNRIWQQYFLRGIVATPNDFGRQGSAPSHPELLDWLANRLVQDGWSLKRLHRLIVSSAVYQQTSLRAMIEADTENMLLWRMRMKRLQSEQIRDAMLAVSGELDWRMGGASVAGEIPRRSVY